MKNRNLLIKFGEEVEGYDIAVLNEREIRAAAGILFLFMFISLMMILFNNNFILIKYVIVVFFTDLVIRVFVNPRFSPLLILGRLIVSGQVPEYVGAAQKKFPWKIGIALAGLMFILLVIINSYSIFTGLCCLFCLVFLFFESSFGICVGCLVYRLFYRKKVRYCAGEICDKDKKQDIQNVSGLQILILLILILFIVLLALFFNHQFAEKPRDLWKIIS